MITKIEDYNREGQSVLDDFLDRVEGRSEVRWPTLKYYKIDKPIHILVNNSKGRTLDLVDKGDYYEHIFPCQGYNPKSYTNDFAWVIDENTVFTIERPFKNRVIKLLKELLPDHDVRTIKNDVMIDNYKIGPTYVGGAITDWSGENNLESSSLIYCMRWSKPEELDNYFAGDPNHEKRKISGLPIGSLDMFLDISKDEFGKLLEAME